MTVKEINKKAQESYSKYFKDVKPASESIDRHDVVLDVNKLENEVKEMIK